MILSHQTLFLRLLELIGDEHRDPALINPASIDIRVGNELQAESGPMIDLGRYSAGRPYWFQPGEFVLVSTLERLRVPLDLAVELKLKSSRAREGYNHSLAFWFDPGWDGIGTMELKNYNQRKPLPLYSGLRIAQIVVHQLDEPCAMPYVGRYNGASSVEASKG